MMANIRRHIGNRPVDGLAALLTIGLWLHPASVAYSQERVYPPEPQEAVGIRLTPLNNLQFVENEAFQLLTQTETKPASKTTPSKPNQPSVKKATPQAKPASSSKTSTPTASSQPAATPGEPAQPAMLPPMDSSAIQPAINDKPTEPAPEMSLKPPAPPVNQATPHGISKMLPRQAVTYTPLEAIVIFPVIKHGREKAFGDLPVIFARELALRLEATAPKTRIYNPVYTVDELKVRGLGHVYEQIMRYYLKAGRPEPKATDYMLKQLALSDGKAISRIIFVEADLDVHHFDQASGVFDRLNSWLTDSTIKQMKYFVNSKLQVFDSDNPELPMVWRHGWRRSIKTSQFANITPSVFDDSDSQHSLADLSRTMSRELLWLAPKDVYMAPQYDLSVQGQLASRKQASPQSGTPATGKEPLNEVNKKAIQRILQRQN